MGPSQVMSMIAHRRIETELSRVYKTPRELRDAEHILDLTSKAGIWKDVFWESQLQLAMFLCKLMLIGFLAEWHFQRSQGKALQALHELVASEPEYWGPIMANVRRIVVQQGYVEGRLGSKQVTVWLGGS